MTVTYLLDRFGFRILSTKNDIYGQQKYYRLFCAMIYHTINAPTHVQTSLLHTHLEQY